jgi:hypothetical protein
MHRQPSRRQAEPRHQGAFATVGRNFEPVLPIPSEQDAWGAARPAAMALWRQAAADLRITKAFRAVCAQKLRRLEELRP